MFPGYSNDITIEHDGEADDLRRLAVLDEDAPIAVPALVAHTGGRAVAALSLVDGRALADPFERTDSVLTVLRLRARSIRAAEAQPSLRERITIQLRRRGVAPAVG